MKRTGFRQSENGASSCPKLRKCAVRKCRKPFIPGRPFITWCSEECGADLAEQKLAKQKAKSKREERAKDSVKRERLKTIPELLSEAQRWFNQVIRLRDKNETCISCHRSPVDVHLSGGSMDCGHYRSVGSAGHLRFNEDNAHSQCKYCNRHLAGNHVQYRIGLETKIGTERLIALENNNVIHKWTHDGLRELIAYYRKRVRELKKGIEHEHG